LVCVFTTRRTKGCAGKRAVTRRGNGQHGHSERAAVDGARARPMLRRLENAKENGSDQNIVIVIVMVVVIMVVVMMVDMGDDDGIMVVNIIAIAVMMIVGSSIRRQQDGDGPRRLNEG
jgi:hypothetical protein